MSWENPGPQFWHFLPAWGVVLLITAIGLFCLVSCVQDVRRRLGRRRRLALWRKHGWIR